MSLKDNNNNKSRQNNWIKFPKNTKKKLNFNQMHNKNNCFSTINFIDSQYNFNKRIQKKRPPNILYDNRSSSTSNFNSKNNKAINSLAFYPLNLKIPIIYKSNKNIDKKILHNKSKIDIITIPKTNLNNNERKINFNIKMNTNKNKENKNINYLLSACNLSAKNINSGIFKKKIKDKINNKKFNNLSNSMTFINKNKTTQNSISNNSNIIGNITNTNNNLNNTNNKNAVKLEEAKKEQERLNEIYNEKSIFSQKIGERIKELESKNKILLQKINKIKKENDNFASTLDKIIKLIKLLKNNGFDVGDIIKNLSIYDNEESNEEEDEEKNKERDSISTIKEFSFKIGNDKIESNSLNDIETKEHIKYIKKKEIEENDVDIPLNNIKKMQRIK